MSVDPKLAAAVREAVSNAGQSESLARKLNAWLSAVADGNEDINDQSQADRHLEFIYAEVALGDEDDDAQNEMELAGVSDEEDD